MLEKAKKVTKRGEYIYIQYARFADDIVILVNYYYKWLARAAYKRLVQELNKLGVKINTDKTKIIDLTKGDSFSFLGFVYRRTRTRRGKWGVSIVPKMKTRTDLLKNLKEIFLRYKSQHLSRIVEIINPILRGWTNYFRIGNSFECFAYVRDWVEKKIRRHLMRVRKLHGFGWNRWSRDWLYNALGLYNNYRVRYCYA